MARAPLIRRMPPSRESSPKKMFHEKIMINTNALPANNIPKAIGKSKRVPSFFKSAGARLTVIFFAGRGYPLFFKAV